MGQQVHERAGELPRGQDLVDLPALDAAYQASPAEVTDLPPVRFGTSGHRGTAQGGTFTEAHVLAIVQAVADYRRAHRVGGRLFLGRDTHRLSELAYDAALEVLAANGVDVVVQARGEHLPTPVLSHAILAANRGSDGARPSDGIVLTPSHNPPEDGGIKYNPPHGGPAGPEVTSWIEERANAILRAGLRDVRRSAMPAPTEADLAGAYVSELDRVIDLAAVSAAGLRIAVDAVGSAALAVWPRIAERHRLDLSIHNAEPDPTFRFVRLDWDGRIRMDCSSPHAMSGLAALAAGADLAVATDTDADRHGVAAPGGALMQPNRFLAVAAEHLFARRGWPRERVPALGKTVVTTHLLDRIAAAHGRDLVETPTGFKWFVDGLGSERLGFAAEESAGAALLCRDGRSWTTDKDGIAPCLLAAEILATTGRNLAECDAALDEAYGPHVSGRIDRPATPEDALALERMEPRHVEAAAVAGAAVERVLSRAPGNDAPIGGVKVETGSGWFAIRPSGTEATIKLYAESFEGSDHLGRLQEEGARVARQAIEAVRGC